MTDYCIKPGYRINSVPEFYNDSLEDSEYYQLDVYKYAASLIRQHEISSVLDIGCGAATKLRDYIYPECNNITGIDSQHAISLCRELYDFGDWHVADLEDESYKLDNHFDLIICADVVEHLIDPDKLLSLIKECAHSRSLIVLSTPERDLRRGLNDIGPPENKAHVREWNKQEFSSYLSSRAFKIKEHEIVQLCEGMKTCQLVMAES